ncbi:MAG: hypothetical protein GSR85_01840 [Desulfurococcales archaeon]|nr:hypothetical protein [Desulfurococcales archaeon]
MLFRGVLTRVLRALSEAELGGEEPARIVVERLLPLLSSRSIRLLGIAALTVDLSPVIKWFRGFSWLSVERRREWLSRLKPEGMVRDLVNMLELVLLAASFVDQRRASSIG